MQLPRRWFSVDVIATLLHEQIVIHSSDGHRVARPLRRVASQLGFDRQGEALFTGVITDIMAGPQVDHVRTEGGIECHTHWIAAPDGQAVGLVVWIAAPPTTPRPVYNSWILDLQKVATRSGGDNLSIIGDGRKAGEERAIRHLLRHMIPDDAGEFLALYYGAQNGKEGRLTEASWSVRRPDDPGQWVHFWSSTTALGASGDRDRTVYGLTAQLRHREMDTRMSTLVRYTNSTLLMVDARSGFVVSTTGELAPAFDSDEPLLRRVLDQIDMKRITPATSHETVVEQTISIEGSRFNVATFAVPNARQAAEVPLAILLVPATSKAG
ncbi:hypothetical protein ACFWF7_10060 [Nocardia sp. NPDC060256]|uniref:hypothetical protein n=1 Tax=unclassified Nocardia TaxID=2637762 RepID=UPI00365B5611